MRAERLLRHSRRIDEARENIASVIGIICGLLSEEKLQQRESETVSSDAYHAWTFSVREDGKPRMCLYQKFDGEARERLCDLPRQVIKRENVLTVQASLDDLIMGLQRLFPKFSGKVSRILRNERNHPQLVYELVVPRGGRDDEPMLFRKESNLSFPLPRGTEVHVFLEHEKYDTGHFFTVSSYQHQVSTAYGTVTEDDFVMQLTLAIKPPNYTEIDDYDQFIELLKLNGWEKCP